MTTGMRKVRHHPDSRIISEQLIISLSARVFVIGDWTIEQGQFTKPQHGDMQPANTTQLLHSGSLKFIWGRPLCLRPGLG